VLQGSIPGFPFLASIIAIFSGAQLFALGIIGEYVAVIHARLLDRPVYVIEDHAKYWQITSTARESNEGLEPVMKTVHERSGSTESVQDWDTRAGKP